MLNSHFLNQQNITLKIRPNNDKKLAAQPFFPILKLPLYSLSEFTSNPTNINDQWSPCWKISIIQWCRNLSYIYYYLDLCTLCLLLSPKAIWTTLGMWTKPTLKLYTCPTELLWLISQNSYLKNKFTIPPKQTIFLTS